MKLPHDILGMLWFKPKLPGITQMGQKILNLNTHLRHPRKLIVVLEARIAKNPASSRTKIGFEESLIIRNKCNAMAGESVNLILIRHTEIDQLNKFYPSQHSGNLFFQSLEPIFMKRSIQDLHTYPCFCSSFNEKASSLLVRNKIWHPF